MQGYYYYYYHYPHRHYANHFDFICEQYHNLNEQKQTQKRLLTLDCPVFPCRDGPIQAREIKKQWSQRQSPQRAHFQDVLGM